MCMQMYACNMYTCLRACNYTHNDIHAGYVYALAYKAHNLTSVS